MGYIFTDPENAAALAGYVLRHALAEGDLEEAKFIINNVESWRSNPREEEAYRLFMSKYREEYRKAVELLARQVG